MARAKTPKTFHVTKVYRLEVGLDVTASSFEEAAGKRAELKIQDFVDFTGEHADSGPMPGGFISENT